MERSIADGNFMTRNLSLLFVAGAYLAALTSQLWGLGWDSPVLAPWAALVLLLIIAGTWRYLRPGRSYPATDLQFIIPLAISVNLLSVLIGANGQLAIWLLNILFVALCAVYYSIWFNFAVAGIIFLLECAKVFFEPGAAGTGAAVNLGVYGAYLAAMPLVLGRLFRTEYKKKERAVSAFKRLKEDAGSIDPENAETGSVRSLSEAARTARNVDAAAELKKSLVQLLDTARSAIPAENALLFMPDSDGETASLRAYVGSAKLVEDCKVVTGQGLLGWILKEKKPVLVHDDARGLGYLENEKKVRSFIAAPVMDGERLEGIIALDSSEKKAFSDVDKGTLERFGTIALNLLRNARAYRQVDQSASNFASLLKITTDMSSSLDLGTILERLSVSIRDVVAYDYFTLCLVDTEGSVAFKKLKGFSTDDPPKSRFPVAETYLGWIIANGQKLSFNDFDQRTDKLPIFPARELQADFRSFIGIPLKSHDNVLGVMTVALKQSGGISAYQQDMLGIIAAQVAASIANARLHNTIRKMATTDGLTGLINHRHFQDKTDERFARAARYPEDISLLLFDIDHFKKVNDTFGHPIGDAVLRKVGAILREAARDVDVAARYGGEEFAVVMEKTDEASALKMAERIRTTIEKSRFVFEGKEVPITVSIGCASHPSHCKDKKELIEKADQSLYWAKKNGRNRCCPYSSIASTPASAQ